MKPRPSKTPALMSSAAARKPYGLLSVKNRIMVFALAATLIPAITLGSLSYLQNKRLLHEQISQELRDATSRIVREIDMLVAETLYDVQVLASSSIISENLPQVLGADGAALDDQVAMRLIREYLRSVRLKFSDYSELMLIDLEGRLVATSASVPEPPTLPAGWRQAIGDGRPVIDVARFDRILKTRTLLIADPIRSPQGRVIGLLGAELALDALDRVLSAYAQTGTREAYLINEQGHVLAGSHRTGKSLDGAGVTKLYDHMGTAVTYAGPGGLTVIGTLKRVPALGWGVVAEMNEAGAFAPIETLQHMTLVLVGCLVAGIGLSAYLLGLTIVRPLQLLSRSADQAAAGNLDVDLPAGSRSEVGHLTRAFNHMVARLRQGQGQLASINAALQATNLELQQLSVTDELTGLNNRKHLMETVRNEIVRSRRNRHPFALLIIAIDHFKSVSDIDGRRRGDAVLRRVAGLLRQAVRSCDYVARYDGEEFIVMLPEVGGVGGLEAAERIRERIARESIDPRGDRITISIGIAVFDEHGGDPEQLFRQADQALAKAKSAGRGRIAATDHPVGEKAARKPIRLIPKDLRRTPV